MALPDKHPEYSQRVGQWVKLDDCYAGEEAIKTKKLEYLPATEGMVTDGMTTPTSPGWKDYESYLLRAYYHNYIRDAVKAIVGIIHAKPAQISVPDRMLPLIKNMTKTGETAQALLRRINTAQLVKGRLGLLVDVPTGATVDKALPYVAVYDALRVINWDEGQLNEGANVLQLVVLDESGFRREGFTWKQEVKYRVLTKGVPESIESGWESPKEEDPYAVCVKVNDSSMPVAADFKIPEMGGIQLKRIPFIFVNADDLVPSTDIPPLLTLANLSLAIYRADADYRQTLFLQGQQTLVLIGPQDDDETDADSSAVRVGNKAVLRMRLTGDAKYIGVSAEGLQAMETSLTNDKLMASQEGSKFLDATNDQGQSGEALRVRVAAKTTTLLSISRTGGEALEQVLKIEAEWMGEDPDEVKVVPNTDFADQSVQGAALLAFMQAKQMGLPLSLKSLHRMMRNNDLTELSFEEEQEQVDDEADTLLGSMATPPQMDPNGEDNFLDESGNPQPQPGQPAAPPKSPTNGKAPIKPHMRGSPTPAKLKKGAKGASAGKKNGKVQ
jgi:hypothetical protein